MASNFIFVESVQKIIQNGGDEIRVSKDTKISPAAFDLIHENQIKIINEEALLPEINMIDESEGDITENDVEEITQRIIERLKELKSCEHKSSDDEQDVSANEEQTVSNDDDLVICRCEEISKKEIREVIRNGINTLNGIKRVTRSGMGLCQGQTCQSLVTRILAAELGISPSKLEPTTARAPVRPIRLSVFAGKSES